MSDLDDFFNGCLYALNLEKAKLMYSKILALENDLLSVIEALADNGLIDYQFEYEGAAIASNSDFNNMIDDIFNGDGSQGQPFSEIPDTIKNKVLNNDDFEDFLDDIFNP